MIKRVFPLTWLTSSFHTLVPTAVTSTSGTATRPSQFRISSVNCPKLRPVLYTSKLPATACSRRAHTRRKSEEREKI